MIYKTIHRKLRSSIKFPTEYLEYSGAQKDNQLLIGNKTIGYFYCILQEQLEIPKL